MLGDISVANDIYIVCGYTDMRKSIDGLCAIIIDQLHMDPRRRSLYLFCGRRCDRIKALLWEADGFVLLYKRLSVEGKYRWPRDKSEVRQLTWQQFDWLMSGLEIEQPKAIGAHKKVDNLSPTLGACSQVQKAPQSLENTAFFTVNKAPDLV